MKPRKVGIQEVRVEIPSSITSSQVFVPVVVEFMLTIHRKNKLMVKHHIMML